MSKIFILFFTCCLYASTCFSQNIGIGTKTPAEKLHVAGNIRSDTVKADVLKLIPNAGEGKILTSDANGNASWKESAALSSRVTDVPGNVGFGVWGDCGTNGTITEYNPVSDSTLKGSASFGRYVAISGNFAIVGAPFNDLGINVDQGSAHIFQYVGNEWVQTQRLTDNPGHTYDAFGNSVAIAGNFAVVGQEGDDVGANVNQGSVCIFQYNGTSWILTQKLTDPAGIAYDFFGSSVSISGNYLIVGARAGAVGPNPDYGYASIYRYNGSSWIFQQKLTDIDGADGDGFGYSVSISGNDVLIGSYNDDMGANSNQGSVCFFRDNGSSWALVQKMTSTSPQADQNYGSSVSIAGNYAVVGAPNRDININMNQGKAYAYRYNGFSWVVVQEMEGKSGGENDRFGNSVQISGNYMIIGGYDYHPTLSGRGSATIFTKLGGGWQPLQLVIDPNGEGPWVESFGIGVGIDGTTRRFVCGSTGFLTFNGKAVFGKIY
jgi:hypothetical protein